MIYVDGICGFINQSLSGDTLTDNLAISTYWIGRDASGLTFDANNNAVITVGLYLGTNGIGNSGEVLTFATGATGAATFAGNVYVGANGIGRDASVLTFATGGTGLATLGGGLTIAGNLLIAANYIGNTGTCLSFATGDTGLATFTGAVTIGGNLLIGANSIGNTGTVLSFATGDTGLATFAGALAVGGDVDMNSNDILEAGGIISRQTYGFGLLDEAAAGNNPTVCPNGVGDVDTGLGWVTADQMTIVAGGVELMRLVERTGGNYIDMKAPVHYSGHQFTDNFMVTSKNYGNRWDITNVNGTGTNVIKTPAGEGGVTLLTTSATTGHYECTQTEGVYFSRALNPMTCIHICLDTTLANKEVKFGFSDNPMVEDGKYCCFLFDYSADNVNWWSHSSDGTDASLASGPTAGTAQDLKLYLTTAGVAYFYVDDVLKGTVTGAVSDTTSMYLFYGIETETGVEVIEVDHIHAAWGY